MPSDAERTKQPYVVVKRPCEMWLRIRGTTELMEEAELAKINNFLKGHDWGAKAPVSVAGSLIERRSRPSLSEP